MTPLIGSTGNPNETNHHRASSTTIATSSTTRLTIVKHFTIGHVCRTGSRNTIGTEMAQETLNSCLPMASAKPYTLAKANWLPTTRTWGPTILVLQVTRSAISSEMLPPIGHGATRPTTPLLSKIECSDHETKRRLSCRTLHAHVRCCGRFRMARWTPRDSPRHRMGSSVLARYFDRWRPNCFRTRRACCAVSRNRILASLATALKALASARARILHRLRIGILDVGRFRPTGRSLGHVDVSVRSTGWHRQLGGWSLA